MKVNGSKSKLFFIELMVVIVVFSIAASVCVSLFVTAHLKSRDSREIYRAALLAQNTAEQCKAEDIDAVLRSLKAKATDKQEYVVYYNDDWQPGAQGRRQYQMRMICTYPAKGMLSVEILVEREAVELFSIEVKRCLEAGV